MALNNKFVSFWKLDTNGSAPDAVASNDLTISGATYTASGKINGAYSFDGVNDYLYNASEITTSFKAISFWFKNDDAFESDVTTGQPLVQLDSNAGDIETCVYLGKNTGDVNDEMITLRDNDADLWYWTFTDCIGGDTLSSGSWHHIVITWEATNSSYRLYFDGNDIGLADEFDTPSEVTTVDDINIGRRVKPTYFDGTIDAIGICDLELDSSDASDLNNSGNGAQYPFGSALANKAFAAWPFDGDATDSVASNDGAVNGASVDTSNKEFGSASYSFDGANDNIVVDSNDISGLSYFGISVWADFDALSADRCLVGNWASGTQQVLLFYDTPNVLRIIFKDNVDTTRQVIATYTPPTDGTWIHIFAEFNGDDGEVKLFVNNSQIGSTTSWTGGGADDIIQTADNDIHIGTDNDDSRDFDGNIDEVVFFNEQPTSQEMIDLQTTAYPYSSTPITLDAQAIFFGGNF